jgi:hypothetical protein
VVGFAEIESRNPLAAGSRTSPIMFTYIRSCKAALTSMVNWPLLESGGRGPLN